MLLSPFLPPLKSSLIASIEGYNDGFDPCSGGDDRQEPADKITKDAERLVNDALKNIATGVQVSFAENIGSNVVSI